MSKSKWSPQLEMSWKSVFLIIQKSLVMNGLQSIQVKSCLMLHRFTGQKMQKLHSTLKVIQELRSTIKHLKSNSKALYIWCVRSLVTQQRSQSMLLLLSMCMRRMSSVTLLTATFKININSNGYPNFVIIGTKMIKSKTNAGVSVLPLFSPTVMSTSETLVVLLLHL